MATHVALHHRSVYKYDRPVTHFPHIVRLRPAPHCRTPILSYSLKIHGAEPFLNWQQDPFSNYLARLSFSDPITELVVEVAVVAEMSVYNPFDFFLEEDAEEFPFTYEESLKKELAPFLEVEEDTPEVVKCNEAIDRTRRRTIDYLVSINGGLAKDIKYGIRLEPGVQTPEETLTLKSGSCRDTAWLQVNRARLRSEWMPSR